MSQTQSSSVYSISPPPLLHPVQPPERSQTQTPGSTSSTSGAISRTLSRLRERSRSLSSSRRSRSRPQSLVLLNSNHGSELQTVEDASPRTARNVEAGAPSAAESSRRGSEFGLAAISPWDEPDEVAALGAAVENVPLPDRLGVLPSPAVDSFSAVQDSPSKTAEEGGRYVTGSPTKLRSLGETVESGAVSSEEDHNVEKTEPTTALPLADEASRDVEVENQEDELYDTTPKQDRFFAPTREAEANEDIGETTPTAYKAHHNMDIPAGTEPAYASDAEQAIAGSETRDERPTKAEDKQPDLPAPEETTDAALILHQKAGVDDGAPISRQSTDLLSVPAIEEPSGTQEWDKRSVISSNNDYQDAKQEASEDDKQSSRRSSVSSLGQAHDMDSQQPVMSSLAVPAGPSPEQSTLKPDDKFMNRPYQFGGDGRSKSYISLGRDSTGAPLQETLDIAEKSKNDSVDLSSFSGPPSGAVPFQRQPAVRDVSGEHRPKRFSGMVKGRRPTLTSPDSPTGKAPTYAPAASAISDHYGLEGLHDDSENVVVGEVPPHRVQDNQEEKKAKRRSGLFDAFKRSPSASKPEFSRESSTQRLDSQLISSANHPANVTNQTRAAEPPKNITKTPQRASTTAKEPEQKKKRFSGFGSIFGRSSTTGHKSEKPRKLMKQNVPGREASQCQATEPAPNYEASEAMRQQRRVEQQERQPNTYPPPSMVPPSQQYSLSDGNVFKSPEDMRPPPGGWYAPLDEHAEEQAIPLDDPPQYRSPQRDVRRDSPFRQIPEAFRPAEPSYERSLGPIGPPPGAGMYSPPTSPVSPGAQARHISNEPRGGYDQLPIYGQPQTHLSRYVSNESEVSGQSEWERSRWRRQSSSPSVSPVQTRSEYDGFPPGRNFRVGSITEEMARSPAKEYADQQTPWAISLPKPGEQDPRRFAWVPSHGTQENHGPPPPPVDYAPGGIGYAEEYPPPNGWQQRRGWPMSPVSPGSSMPMQQFDPIMAHAPVFEDHPPRSMMRSQGNAYPSPPTSPESQWFYSRAGLPPPSQMQYQARSQDPEMPPHPRKRFYSQQRAFSYENDLLPAQPRRMSGYTGRRDDPTVGEESVEMRGVSYPGQEWTPERWD